MCGPSSQSSSIYNMMLVFQVESDDNDLMDDDSAESTEKNEAWQCAFAHFRRGAKHNVLIALVQCSY